MCLSTLLAQTQTIYLIYLEVEIQTYIFLKIITCILGKVTLYLNLSLNLLAPDIFGNLSEFLLTVHAGVSNELVCFQKNILAIALRFRNVNNFKRVNMYTVQCTWQKVKLQIQLGLLELSQVCQIPQKSKKSTHPNVKPFLFHLSFYGPMTILDYSIFNFV